MKLKIGYIYPAIIIIAVVLLIVFTNKSDKPDSKTNLDEISSQQMPDDEIHRGLKSEGGTPSSMNVSKEFQRMMEKLKTSVEQNPNDTVKLKEYADLLSASHKVDEAIPLYEKILKKDAKRTDVLLALSLAYYNKQDFTQAENYTKKILQIDKNNNQAMYNLGAIYATRGENDKAKKIWEDLEKKNPNNEIGKLARNSIEQLK
ncbi:MAG: tetratricopeptide repeat protein [Ignavibacteria bacterium]|nr:tetratricopeptide repeat protein [Ignavibacteria bacterium]